MAVSTPFATPGFTPEDSAARLARVQAVAAESGVDGILFVGGVDGKDNLGSVQGLNYLLGGLSGYDLLERQRVVSPWLEDVVLFVTPDTVDVHVGPEAYETLRPVAAVWSRGTKVTVRALPPRRVAAAERDAETRAEAKRQEEARRRKARLEGDDVETREEEDPNEAPTEKKDDASVSDASRSSDDDADDSETDDLTSDDEDDDEDEDAAQDFKLESFVDMFVGVTTIGIALVVPFSSFSCDEARDSTNRTKPDPFLAAAELERWPLAMAYGLEGVGRSGFFTMNFNVQDVGASLRKTCYARLDRASLKRELDHTVPQFLAQWLDVVESLEESSAARREEKFAKESETENKTDGGATRNERAFAEALFDFFEYGSLRAPHGVRPACVSRDAPRVTLRGTHATVEATHPKSPGVTIARTFFARNLTNRRGALASSGFAENDRFVESVETTRETQNDDDDDDDTYNDDTYTTLVGAHAGVVAAARAAARARLSTPANGSTDSAADSFLISSAARAAFLVAAETSGVRGSSLGHLADTLVVRSRFVSFAREDEDEDETRKDAFAGGSFLYVRAGIETRLESSLSRDASSLRLLKPLDIALAHGDTFVRGDVYPVAVTGSVPVSLRWPGVEEERFCEDARAVVDRATRDAFGRGGGRRQVSKKTDTAAHPAVGSAASAAPSSAQKAPRNPLALATDPVAAEEEEEAFFDDELMSSSEDEESQESPVVDEAEEEEEDDDDDDSGPASRSRLVLDSRARRIGERSSLLLPTPEKVCLFPAFAKALPTIHQGDDVVNGDGTDEAGVVAEALRELACPRNGVARGEWRVFDDGVAFVHELHSAPPLILTLGGNVDGVDVYDAESESESDDESAERKSFGVARDADVPRAARRRREAFASATTVAFRLKPDVVTASIVSMCFSLAPMPAKSRRRFLREVLPRWKARGGATNIRRVSEECFSETHALSRRTRVALARARADARSAAASLALTMPRALLRAPVGFGVADAMAEAALDRASRRDAERAAARVDECARRGIFVPGDDDDDDDEASSSAVPDALFSSTEDVPVSLLTGAPDGCQSAVFEALELFAPNAATWIDAPVFFATETHGEGASFVSETAFVSALRAATPRVLAALAAHRASPEKTPKPRVVLVARTRATPRVARRAFRDAVKKNVVDEEEETTTQVRNIRVIRYVAGATCSCVTASGFFPEAERRPADCAAAADGADVVVLLPTAATERGDCADAAAGSLGGALARLALSENETPESLGVGGSFGTETTNTNDPDAETLVERAEDARRWLVGFLGKATADERLVVGRARLRRDPLFAVTLPTSAAFLFPRRRARKQNSHVSSPRETGRVTIATGRLDVAAVADFVRALFKSGRAPPPPSPETLKGLAPTARLERQLARFAEREADGAHPDAPFRATHARVTVTFCDEHKTNGVDEVHVKSVATRKKTMTVAYNFSSAAPFRGADAVDVSDKKRRPVYASRVEVFLLGFGSLKTADVASRLAACAYAGPAPLQRATIDSLSPDQKKTIEDALFDDPSDQNVPPGWYHDGCKWIDFDGSVSYRHPLFNERAEKHVREVNVKIDLENARRADARAAAAAATRVERDEDVF